MQPPITGRSDASLLGDVAAQLPGKVHHSTCSFRCKETTSNYPHRTQVKASRSHKLGVYMLVLCLAVCIPATQQAIQNEDASTLASTTGVSPSDSLTPISTDASLFESTAPANLSATEDLTAPTAANQLNTNVKLKPINFTLVDQMFERVLSDEEVAKRWRTMDAQIQEGVKSILKMVFPQIVALSQDAKVSGDCSGGILKWILSLRNLRSWALKMLDATGKPTAGIFQGSLNMFGNYRQCLSVRAPDEDEIEITEQFEEYFRGQFCVIHLRPWMPAKRPYYHLNSTIDSLVRDYKYYEKVLYDDLAEIAVAFNFVDIHLDLCVPSTCSMADIQRVADLLSSKVEMRAKVDRCSIAPRDSSVFKAMDRTTYFWLLAPLMLLIITVVASILRYLSTDSNSTNTTESPTNILKSLCFFACLKDRWMVAPVACRRCRKKEENEQDQAPSTGSPHLPTQMESHLSKAPTVSATDKPIPLYGIRTILVVWFIIVQMTVELKYQYLRESLSLRDMLLSYWPFQIIINSTFIYESFILVTAFAYGYHCLEFNFRQLVGYVVDKYIRLILPIITLIALVAFTPLMAIQSPNWHNFVEEQSLVCKSNGALNLFFLQNFIAYDKICLPHTWLLCVEFQLILLSLPVVLLLKKSFLSTEDLIIIGDREHETITSGKKQVFGSISVLIRVILTKLVSSKAGILSVMLTLLGVILNFTYVYLNQLPPKWFYTFPDPSQRNQYFSSYFIKTWTHLSVFMMGLIGGHLCRAAIQLRRIQVSLLEGQRTNCDGNSKSGITNDSQQWSSSLTNNSTGKLNILTKASTIMSMEQEHQQVGTHTGSASLNNRIKPSRFDLSSIFLVASLITMAALIFSTFSWSTQQIPSPLVSAAYDSLSRVAWSLALVAIMIHLCFSVSSKTPNTQRSVAAKLLSLPACVRLGRLSYLTYLLTPYVNTFILAVAEQSLFPSLFLIFHFIVGNIVIIYTLALLLAITIEQPIRRLLRIN